MVEKGWIGRRTCNTVGEAFLVGWVSVMAGTKKDMALFIYLTFQYAIISSSEVADCTTSLHLSRACILFWLFSLSVSAFSFLFLLVRETV